MKLVNRSWVDENGNSWSTEKYTESCAMAMSSTLVQCRDCSNCRNCVNCERCSECRDCIACELSTNCHNCKDCYHCFHCKDCVGCIDYSINPERIVSKYIGFGIGYGPHFVDDHTTVYWVGDNIQVVCSWFKGSIKDFESAVNNDYDGTDLHRYDYIEFIHKVKKYIGVPNNNWFKIFWK